VARWTPGPYIYSSWQPSEAMLDSFARKHLSYELQALTGQSARLIRIYPNLLDQLRMPSSRPLSPISASSMNSLAVGTKPNRRVQNGLKD